MKKLFQFNSFSWNADNTGGRDDSGIATPGGRFYFGAELTVPPPPVQNNNNGHINKLACPTVGENLVSGTSKTKDRKNRSFLRTAFTAIILFLTVAFLQATNYTATKSGDFNDPTTWGGTGVQYPHAGDAALIGAGFTVTVTSNSACTSLQIAGGGAGTGTLTFADSGSPVLTVSGAVLVSQNSGGKNRIGTITFISGSTLVAGSLTLGASGGPIGHIDMINGGTLQVDGTITVNGSSDWNQGTGTVKLTATNTLPATVFTSFNNLFISANTTTLGVAIAVSNNLSVNGTLNLNGKNSTAKTLTFLNVGQVSGVWGTSGKANNNATRFNGTGQVTVTNSSTTTMVTTLPGQIFTEGSGNSGTVTAQTAGTSFNIVSIRATDGYNSTLASYSGSKTIGYTGPGGSPTYTTAVDFTNGISTTTLATTLNKAQSTTITADDGTYTGIASSNLTVNAGTVTKLQVLMPGETAAPGTTTGKTGAPTTQTAGTSFNVTMNAVDANWNMVSNTHTVAITSSDGNAILPSNAALVGGTKAFAVTFRTSSVSGWIVTASDVTGSPTLTANTGTATPVNPNTLDHFAISAISSPQVAGNSFTIASITAQDAANNTVTDFSGTGNTVNITATGGTLTAGGGTTATFSSGVLASHSVTLTPGAASVTLTAIRTSGGSQTGSSNSFTVNNPSPTVTSISPTRKCAGDGAFTLTVNGTGFNSSSVVRIGGSDKTTTFVSSTQVTAAILTVDIASAGTPAITVFNPTPVGGTSGTATLTTTSTGTWLGIASSAWENAANWCGGVPTSATAVVIPAAGITNWPAISTGVTGNCSSLTFGGAASTLNFTGGNLTVAGNVDFTVGVISASATSTLFVGGTWTGTGNTFSPGTYLAVNYNGAAQTAAPLNYYNLTLSGSGVKTITNIGTVNGNFTLSGDNTTYASTTVTLNIGGDFNVNSGNTISLINGNPSLNVGGHTTISGTVTSPGASKTFAGNFTINPGGTWTETGVIPEYNFGMHFTNYGTFTPKDGNHTFTGNGYSIAGILSIPKMIISGSYANNGTLTVGASLSGTGSLTQGTSGVLNIGGTISISTLTATAGNMVNYTGADQTVFPTTYTNLTLSGTGAKIINTAASGNLATGILNIDHASG